MKSYGIVEFKQEDYSLRKEVRVPIVSVGGKMEVISTILSICVCVSCCCGCQGTRPLFLEPPLWEESPNKLYCPLQSRGSMNFGFGRGAGHPIPHRYWSLETCFLMFLFFVSGSPNTLERDIEMKAFFICSSIMAGVK